jgi:hypothetical protein
MPGTIVAGYAVPVADVQQYYKEQQQQKHARH